jgi:hypothetical protein
MSKSPLTQPKFDSRINALAFPMQGPQDTPVGITRGYMRQYQPLPGYGAKSVIHYQYNPSTVSSDYNLADASAQASLNFPNSGDTAQLAIPLSQTVSWTLMYDRTYELWGSYNTDGNTKYPNAAANDPRVIGCEADVMQFKDFTGMLTNYTYGTNGAGGTISAPSQAAQNYSLNQGIMQLVMCYAYFGSSGQANNTQYFGYINEWSVQYTHFTQYNIPMRCVIAVYFTMMPPPAITTTTAVSSPANPNSNWFVPEQITRNNPTAVAVPLTNTTTGKSGR